MEPLITFSSDLQRNVLLRCPDGYIFSVFLCSILQWEDSFLLPTGMIKYKQPLYGEM